MVNPYVDEIISENSWYRTFDPSISNSEEYVWHRDYIDRIVTFLNGTDGWRFQFDNQLPLIINSMDRIKIPKMVYHRLQIGNQKMTIKIEEVN